MHKIPVNFNLPWNTHDNYWLCVVLPEEDRGNALGSKLAKLGENGQYLNDSCYVMSVSKEWGNAWNELKLAIENLHYNNPKVAVIGTYNTPAINEVMAGLQSVEKVDEIASNLWLGEAILEDRVECHFQPILDRDKGVYGYESFVRVRLHDGGYIAGGKIIEASKKIGIHHYLDKFLHIMAIKTFAEAKLEGKLFINFLTGFIQVPAKYLEGLGEAAYEYGIDPSRISLDVSESQQVHDVNQIVSVINFASDKGYNVAMDDIRSLDTLADVLEKTHVDIVKLDRAITQKAALPRVAAEIKEFVDILHSVGAKVLAEGVENETVHKVLEISGVDFFQGYLYAAPMPISKINIAKAS